MKRRHNKDKRKDSEITIVENKNKSKSLEKTTTIEEPKKVLIQGPSDSSLNSTR